MEHGEYVFNDRQEYDQWKSKFVKPDNLDKMKEDLGEYESRENNILMIILITLFALILAILVLWWDPKVRE